MRRIDKKHIFTLTIVSIFSPFLASAQSIMDGASAACRANGTCQLNDVGSLVVNIASIIIGLSGTAALAAFVYGGFRWLISAGSSEGITKGKEAMKGAVIGLAIVFFSYTVVYFVAQSLGVTTGGSLFQWGGWQ